MSSEVGKLRRVPLREVWRNEATDFTRWLKNNIDVLGEAVDMTLGQAETEQAAGDFSVDIVAEDESGAKVVIENQLERSDHDHLGKLLTYLVMIEASTAIWVVSEPRPEHVRAITWLNESTAGDFHLVKVEAVRIDDSPAAPLFTQIVGPSEDSHAVGDTKREWAERHHQRFNFWKTLLEYAKTRSALHANRSPGKENWISAGSGRSGLNFNYVIWERETAVELYIDLGKLRDAENKTLFDSLFAQKAAIEQDFGGPLEWERLDDRRASRIRHSIAGGGYKDAESSWPEIHARMVDAMICLEAAFRPHLGR